MREKTSRLAMTRKKKNVEMKIVTEIEVMGRCISPPIESKYKKWLNEQKAMIDYVYVKLLLII